MQAISGDFHQFGKPFDKSLCCVFWQKELGVNVSPWRPGPKMEAKIEHDLLIIPKTYLETLSRLPMLTCSICVTCYAIPAIKGASRFVWCECISVHMQHIKPESHERWTHTSADLLPVSSGWTPLEWSPTKCFGLGVSEEGGWKFPAHSLLSSSKAHSYKVHVASDFQKQTSDYWWKAFRIQEDQSHVKRVTNIVKKNVNKQISEFYINT